MTGAVKHFIVIDGGTQNIKAFVFDEKGNEIHGESSPVTPYVALQPDFAEQDAEAYLGIAQKVTRSVVQNSGIRTDAPLCQLTRTVILFALPSPGWTNARPRD